MRSCTEPFSEWVDPNDHFQAIIAAGAWFKAYDAKYMQMYNGIANCNSSLMLTFTSIFYHWNVSTLDEGR